MLQPITRDQATQTTSTWTDIRDNLGTRKETSNGSLAQKPELQGRPRPLLHGNPEKSSDTPSSPAEPRIQVRKTSDARLEPRLRDTLKSQNKGHSENLVQSAQEQRDTGYERTIHGPARQIPAIAPEQATVPVRVDMLASNVAPKQVQSSTVPPLTIRPSPILQLPAYSTCKPSTKVVRGHPLISPSITGRILKPIVNNNAHASEANPEHIPVTNTTYFAANACEGT